MRREAGRARAFGRAEIAVVSRGGRYFLKALVSRNDTTPIVVYIARRCRGDIKITLYEMLFRRAFPGETRALPSRGGERTRALYRRFLRATLS